VAAGPAHAWVILAQGVVYLIGRRKPANSVLLHSIEAALDFVEFK
jgi:hypothetical protein